MRRSTFTVAARRMLEAMSTDRQQLLIRLATGLVRKNETDRALYTDAQWRARRNCRRQDRRERERRVIDYAYALKSGSLRPLDVKAPRGWRPDAKLAKEASRRWDGGRSA